MAGSTQSRGICAFCGYETTKGSMARHIRACPERQSLQATREQQRLKAQDLFYIRVEDAYDNRFWLDLEIPGSTKLSSIDHYLRAIWLECCGHLSEFTIGGWGGEELSAKKSVTVVFQPGTVVTHIYDFGTSSLTHLKVVSQRQGIALTNNPIVLLARNRQPAADCIICGEPAAFMCEECRIEDETIGTLCEKHAEDHPHNDYGEPVKLVNSPRLGLCGYEGPAEPPY